MSSMPKSHVLTPQEQLVADILLDSQYKQSYEETSRCLWEHRLDANMLLHVHSVTHTPLSLAILSLPEHDGEVPLTDDNRLCNSPGLVDFLIEKGAYIGSEDNVQKGITQPEGAPLPLAFAIKCGKPHIVQQLIHAGADLNAQSKDGKTALHEAVLKRDTLAIGMLVKAGARTDIADEHGKTARDYADKKMARAIEKATPKPAGAPGRLAQFIEEMGKANMHSAPPTIGGFIP